MSDTKCCSRCTRWVPIEEFAASARDRASAYCRACRRDLSRQSRRRKGVLPIDACAICERSMPPRGTGSFRLRNKVPGLRKGYRTADVCIECYRPALDPTGGEAREWNNPDDLSTAEVWNRVYWRWLYYAAGQGDGQGRIHRELIHDLFGGGAPYLGFTASIGGGNDPKGPDGPPPTVDEILEYLVRNGGVAGVPFEPDPLSPFPESFQHWRALVDAMFDRSVRDGFKVERLKFTLHKMRGKERPREYCTTCGEPCDAGTTIEGLCSRCHVAASVEWAWSGAATL